MKLSLAILTLAACTFAYNGTETLTITCTEEKCTSAYVSTYEGGAPAVRAGALAAVGAFALSSSGSHRRYPMLSFKTLCATAFALTAVSAAPQADPFAFAKAVGLPVAAEATYECHASCGYAILAARKCSPDGNEDADYDSSCLCSSGSEFLSYVPDCLDCGWCLWSDYGKFLTSALGECSTNTEPTGTTCAPSSSQAPASSSAAAESTTEASSSAAASSTEATEASSSEATEASSSTPAASTEAATSSTAAATSSEAAVSSFESASSSAAAETQVAESSSATSSSVAISSFSTSSTNGTISTYSGAGAKLAVGAGAGIVGLAALLM
ncbi:hypothetical protein KL948_001525 [Ogataea haglerorum]|nr:hypothetical protein KL948_001525 [Ogataea haglerorum]